MANTSASGHTSYDDIAKSQKAIEENFSVVKNAVVEIEKMILLKRSERIAAIQAEQVEEAAKLEAMIKVVKTFVVQSQGQGQPQPQPQQQPQQQPQFPYSGHQV